MSLYCYKCLTCGKTHERTGTFKKHPKTVTCSCGKRATRHFQAEGRKGHGEMCDHIRSESLGVLPCDVKRARVQYRKAGFNVTVHDNGNVSVPGRERKSFYAYRYPVDQVEPVRVP